MPPAPEPEPVLLPGAHLLRRADGRVQVGLAPGSAVVLPSAGAVRGSPEVHVSGSAVQAVPAGQPAGADSRWSPHRVAALLRRTGDSAPAAARRLEDTGLEIAGFGPPLQEDLVVSAAEVARLAGLRALSERRRQRPVGLALGVGEPPRELLDEWVREGVPHLVVRLTEGHAVLGPFVVPGRTACLRCVDAHHADQDPSWPLLVTQYARLSRRPRRDGVPEPVDPALAVLAVGWAVRDLCSYVEGGRPSSWSTTIRLSPGLDTLETAPWLRHPECGCSWGPEEHR